MTALTAALGNGGGWLIGVLGEAVNQAGFADAGLAHNDCCLLGEKGL